MSLFSIFGVQFGWDAVVGIIPVVGDAIGVALALAIVLECCQIDKGLSSWMKIRMVTNIALDFALGLVPLVGDFADAAFKCNSQNAHLLEMTLEKRYRPTA